MAVEDVPVPVFTWKLLLCEVDAGRLGKIALGTFDKTVGARSFVRGCDDPVLVVIDP